MSHIMLTGASSGVGAALASRLCADGHRVAGIARNQERLQLIAAESGRNFHPLLGDLANSDELPALAQRVSEALDGAPDILIHNAGTFVMEDFTDHQAEDFERLWRVNTLAPMLLTHALLPAMQTRGSGRIIFIASVAGTHGLPKQTAYCASKHGMVGFADALSRELQGSGIAVHTICPGGIDTPLWQSGQVTYPGDVSDTMRPNELVDLVLFLMQQPSGTRYRRIICFPDNEWH